jgi:hypothetical protein
MTTLKLHYTPHPGPANPRGARAAAAVFAWLLGSLDALIPRRPGAPGKHDAQTAAEEAQAVREMAWRIRESDPRFAADLFAAADRHERLHGV